MSYQYNPKIHRKCLIRDLNNCDPVSQNSSASKFNVQVVGTVLKVYYYENTVSHPVQPERSTSDSSTPRALDSERQITHLILDDSTGVCRIDFLFGIAAIHEPYFNKPKPNSGDTIQVIGECSPSSPIPTILCLGYDLLEDPLSELVCLIETVKFNRSISGPQKNPCPDQPTKPKSDSLKDLISDANDILDDIGDFDDLFDDI